MFYTFISIQNSRILLESFLLTCTYSSFTFSSLNCNFCFPFFFFFHSSSFFSSFLVLFFSQQPFLLSLSAPFLPPIPVTPSLFFHFSCQEHNKQTKSREARGEGEEREVASVPILPCHPIASLLVFSYSSSSARTPPLPI